MSDLFLATQVRASFIATDVRDTIEARYRETQRRAESGEVTSQMILIAVFAALAIAVGLIVWNKTTAKANSIPTDTEFG